MWNMCLHTPHTGGQSSPGVVQSGHVSSNADRQMPHTSSCSSPSSSWLCAAASSSRTSSVFFFFFTEACDDDGGGLVSHRHTPVAR